ncbi:MAG TPA: cation diffusion facilitator family transporter [Candidatus Krumholzibacteriaceae bacterium]|jgi:cation diffusion facilitator family transporter|nr:cation diffusion facilitator family transporter [Candidatus Krumholzibacteriaceae bacterium]
MQKLRVLQLSFLAIASVIIVEGLIGFAVNSLAILSDAAHALFDAITMLILYLTTKMALKPPDEEHPYGHAKIESIGGMIGGISLIALAVVLFFEAMLRLLLPEASHVKPEAIGFLAIFYTLGIDVFRIIITRKTAQDKSETSITVKASFLHALADFMSTVIALVGFGLAALLSFYDADAYASLILSVSLIYLSLGLLRGSFSELSDEVPKDLAEEIKQQVMRVKGIKCCNELKVRRVGSTTFIELTVTAPGEISLKEAHNLTAKIEQNITKAFGKCSVTIHVEPEKGV